jgi:hypothetical protein
MLWPAGFNSPVTPFVLMMLVTLEIVIFRGNTACSSVGSWWPEFNLTSGTPTVSLRESYVT